MCLRQTQSFYFITSKKKSCCKDMTYVIFCFQVISSGCFLLPFDCINFYDKLEYFLCLSVDASGAMFIFVVGTGSNSRKIQGKESHSQRSNCGMPDIGCPACRFTRHYLFQINSHRRRLKFVGS